MCFSILSRFCYNHHPSYINLTCIDRDNIAQRIRLGSYQQAAERSSMWYALWTKCCCYEKGNWIPIKDSTGKPLCADLEQPANPYGESAAPPAMPPTPSRHNYQPKSPTELKGFSIYI